MRTSREVSGVMILILGKREKIKEKRDGLFMISSFHIDNLYHSHTITLFMKPLPTLTHILKQLPSLGAIIQQYGRMSIYEYAQNNYHILPETSPLRESRKHEFLELIGDYVLQNFDESIKKEIGSLAKNYCVSTAEHHGPMGHPFFFQSALLRGLENPDTIINLCTSHVSLGNSSYPRGLVFHGD